MRISGGGIRQDSFSEDLVYRSALMAELLEQAQMLAQGDITVFISGDTGDRQGGAG